MVVVEFLVPHVEAELANPLCDHPRTGIEVVFVSTPTVEIPQAQTGECGARTCDALGGIVREPSREDILAQFACTGIER